MILFQMSMAQFKTCRTRIGRFSRHCPGASLGSKPRDILKVAAGTASWARGLSMELAKTDSSEVQLPTGASFMRCDSKNSVLTLTRDIAQWFLPNRETSGLADCDSDDGFDSESQHQATKA